MTVSTNDPVRELYFDRAVKEYKELPICFKMDSYEVEPTTVPKGAWVSCFVWVSDPTEGEHEQPAA